MGKFRIFRSVFPTVVVRLVTFCVLYRVSISSCPDHGNFIASVGTSSDSCRAQGWYKRYSPTRRQLFLVSTITYRTPMKNFEVVS